MRRTVAAIWVLACVGCSTSTSPDAGDDAGSSTVLLITRPDGHNDSTWQEDRGHLRVEAGCILFKGQLIAFPFETKLVDGSTAVQIGDEAPITLDGTAEVGVTGSKVPLGEAGDWDHAMDTANLDRWSECRRLATISEYARWWQVVDVHLVDNRD